MDVNQAQGQYLIEHGLATRELVSQAYRECNQSPVQDLLAWFQLRGRLAADQCQHIRRALAGVGGGSTTMPVAPPSSAQMPAVVASSPQKTIGDYEILRELGGGGMGEVYVAFSPRIKREVALKVIRAEQLARVDLVERFMLEAETMGQLRHPNIIAVHDFGEDQGRHYLVMDLIDGESLDEKLRKEGGLDFHEAARLIAGAAKGLDYAHKRGILHRDIKPANIMARRSDSKPLVADFGLAKHFESQDVGLTQSGQIVGTPRYMSPEQVNGAISSLDQRSDVYSLGVTLYELITAKPPFNSDNLPQLVQDISFTEAASPKTHRADCPADLETICLKCMEKEPSLRYYTAQELADDLERYLRDESISARPLTRGERFRRWCRRHKSLLQGVGVGVLAIVLPMLYFTLVPLLQESRRLLQSQRHQELILTEAQLWRDEVSRALSEIRRQHQQVSAPLTPSESQALSKQLLEKADDAVAEILDPRAQTKRFFKALQRIGRVPELAPELAQLGQESLQLKLIRTEQAYTQAVICNHVGLVTQAEAYRGQANELAPNSEFGVQARLELGESMLRRGLFQNAERVFRALLEVPKPETRARVYYGLSEALFGQNQIELATEVLLAEVKLEDLPESKRAQASWSRAVASKLRGHVQWVGEDKPQLAGIEDQGRALFYQRRQQGSECHFDFKVYDSASQRLKTASELKVTGAVRSFHINQARGAQLLLMVLERRVQRELRIYGYAAGEFKLLRQTPIPDGLRPFEVKGVGDFDGDGEWDVFMSHERQQVLWFKSNSEYRIGPLLGSRGSYSQLLGFRDYDGDGCDDLFLFAGQWNHFECQVYKGQQFSKNGFQPIFRKRLGSLSSGASWRLGQGRFECLIAVDREPPTDIGIVFGADMSPALPDAVWHISYVKGQFQFLPWVKGPFARRASLVYRDCQFTDKLFEGHPQSFAYRVSQRHSKERDESLIFRQDPKTKTQFRLDLGDSSSTTRDVDGDGDLELLLMSRRGLQVYGLKGLGSEATLEKRATRPLRLDRLGLATAWLEARDYDAAIKVLEDLLTASEDSDRPLVRLQLARALAAKGQYQAARRQCLKVVSEYEFLAVEALRLAVQYAEAGGDARAAINDTRRILKVRGLTLNDQTFLERRLTVFKEWRAMRDVFHWSAETWSDVKARSQWQTRMDNGCFFRLTKEGLGIRANSGVKAWLRVPMKFRACAFEIHLRMKLRVLEHGAGVKIQLLGNDRSRLGFEIRKDGSGDECSHFLALICNKETRLRAPQFQRGDELKVCFRFDEHLGRALVEVSIAGHETTICADYPGQKLKGRGFFEVSTVTQKHSSRERYAQTDVVIQELKLRAPGRKFSLLKKQERDIYLAERLLFEGQIQDCLTLCQSLATRVVPQRAPSETRAVSCHAFFLAALCEGLSSRPQRAFEAFRASFQTDSAQFQALLHAHIRTLPQRCCQPLARVFHNDLAELPEALKRLLKSRSPDTDLVGLFCRALPKQETPVFLRGQIFLKMGDYERAEPLLSPQRGSLELIPRFFVGLLHYRCGEYQQALDAWSLEGELPEPLSSDQYRYEIHAEYMVQQGLSRKQP